MRTARPSSRDDEPDVTAAIEQKPTGNPARSASFRISAHATACVAIESDWVVHADAFEKCARRRGIAGRHSPRRLRTAGREISLAAPRARAWSAGTACTRRPRRPRTRSCGDSRRAGSAVAARSAGSEKSSVRQCRLRARYNRTQARAQAEQTTAAVRYCSTGAASISK